MTDVADPTQLVELADYRARTADLYARVRADLAAGVDPAETWRRWVDERNGLLDTHPQSAVGPSELDFWAYDPAFRFEVVVEPPEGDGAGVRPIAVHEGEGVAPRRFTPVGRVSLPGLGPVGGGARLPLYWADAYSGGFFLPFRDATNGEETFGVGRYVLDGPKSADLGRVPGAGDGERLVIDLNFAYHPSCVWGDWVCPLAHPDSRVVARVEAGERRPWGLGGRR